MNPKAIWTDYLTSLEEAERRHAVTCDRCMSGYNRYYDLASRTSESVAAEALPDDAAAAREVEASAAKLAELRKDAMPALRRAMSAKMSEIASGSRGVSTGLRHALATLDRFRVEDLDGRDGRMRELVLLGEGIAKSEKDRLLNNMVAIWCKANGHSPQAAVEMLKPFGRLLPDPADELGGPGMFLSMAEARGLDIAAALDEAAEWEELDQSKVEEARRLVGACSRADMTSPRP